MVRWSAEAEPCYMRSAVEGDRDGGKRGSRTLVVLASSCSQKEQVGESKTSCCPGFKVTTDLSLSGHI